MVLRLLLPIVPMLLPRRRWHRDPRVHTLTRRCRRHCRPPLSRAAMHRLPQMERLRLSLVVPVSRFTQIADNTTRRTSAHGLQKHLAVSTATWGQHRLLLLLLLLLPLLPLRLRLQLLLSMMRLERAAATMPFVVVVAALLLLRLLRMKRVMRLRGLLVLLVLLCVVRMLVL